ncbi:flagellar motor protein MotB [Pacificibacter marinus]|uniref:Motility protein B n=1 Tax=Pacificibacter marinus TaxID=658057 RepID=A0A1Y5T172_9RHOB|nr:flagellar motor protein MotB [Pacificibacter marinus]SEL04591.1 chemotaxis protein MotB [Pacificibacter marinus]SLN51744.1 Motility protein B [Pacificibacter marinus]
MSAKGNAPIIIKRKKVVGGGGHHGGAWKVAYADFVTAMMAFFLLMWLLNATTEKQRKGIADYFNPTIPVNRISGGGDGTFGGDSVFTEETLAQNGTGAATSQAVTAESSSSDETSVEDAVKAADAKGFSEVQELFTAFSGESMAASEAMRHIVTRVTDEGLIIELFDLKDEPLFTPRKTEPELVTIMLVEMMARALSVVKNDMAVTGYVRSEPLVVVDNPVWNLSTNRADQIRKILEKSGVQPVRVQRVTGYADRQPAVRNPMAARNNRVEIILLRNKVRKN